MIGCSGFPTKQFVPKPETGIDPDNAIIIINRPHATIAAWNNPTVFDNGKPIGEISNGGELKWSRNEGKMQLDIWHQTNDIWGNKGKHTFPNSEIHTTIDVKRNSVYTFEYKFGGITASAINLQGDETSKMYFTSIPSGAVVYAGTDQNNIKQTAILTPHTMTHTPGKTWAKECYKLTLKGYEDSPVFCKDNSFGNRIVHYNFEKPSSPEPPLSELPIRRNDTTKPLIQPAIPQ